MNVRLDREGLRALAREARALSKQFRWLGHDRGEVRRQGGGPTVVLLHGVYASPGVFRPLRARLHHDLDATTVSLGYMTGARLPDIARRLAALIERQPAEGPIHLVGHSLGGLVVRYYVQELSADRRIVQTVSLGAPYRGSAGARLVWGGGGVDIAVGSALLGQIARGSEAGRKIPHLSIAAADDFLVEGPPFPDFGERLILPDVGHNGLLFDPRVAELLVRRIRLC